MKNNHWKRLLCLALVMTLLLSISVVFAADYDKNNPANTYDQTENPFTPEIATDLQYDSYACLGDSISAGFGDYDYYPDDGSLVEDINVEDYSRAKLDSLKWSSIDNYDLYYNDILPKEWNPVGYSNFLGSQSYGNPVSGFTKVSTVKFKEDGSFTYYDEDGKEVTIKEGYVPYTRKESAGTENDFTYMGMRAVDKAYHSIVAKSVGAKTLYPMGYSGTRTTEIRGILDPSYKGDEYLFSYGLVNNYTTKEDGSKDFYTADPDTPVDWNHRSYDFMRDKYLTAIRNSDLITLNLGSNDIMTIPVINAMGKLSGKDDAKFVALAKQMLGESYPEMLNTLFSTANTLNNVQQTLTTLLSLMINGYKLYFQNIMPVIDLIHEENPDADIAVVGLYNPLQKVKLTDQSLIAIGEVGTILITGMNAYLKANAEKHGYAYVDVTDTETQDTYPLSVGLETFYGRIMTDVHPNYGGHEHIAGQILSALETFKVEKSLNMPYADVKGNTAYASDIQYCYDNKLISGTSLHTFAPYMNMTRGMFVASMYALGNKKVNMNTGSSFGTILKSSYFTKALSWAYSNGITFGVNKSLFSPLTRVTREQMAQMLYQYAGKPELKADANLDALYKDTNKVSKVNKDAVLWAATNGILNPEDGILNPRASVTRGELAHALHVYAELEK